MSGTTTNDMDQKMNAPLSVEQLPEDPQAARHLTEAERDDVEYVPIAPTTSSTDEEEDQTDATAVVLGHLRQDALIFGTSSGPFGRELQDPQGDHNQNYDSDSSICSFVSGKSTPPLSPKSSKSAYSVASSVDDVSDDESAGEASIKYLSDLLSKLQNFKTHIVEAEKRITSCKDDLEPVHGALKAIAVGPEELRSIEVYAARSRVERANLPQRNPPPSKGKGQSGKNVPEYCQVGGARRRHPFDDFQRKLCRMHASPNEFNMYMAIHGWGEEGGHANRCL